MSAIRTDMDTRSAVAAILDAYPESRKSLEALDRAYQEVRRNATGSSRPEPAARYDLWKALVALARQEDAS